MTLQGRNLWFALLGSALAGVAVGSFSAGWGRARGVPEVVATVDAGVKVELDAGVSSKADCGATIEHWTTVTVPGPVRYVILDGGLTVERPGPVTTILVPDVRLTGQTASVVTLDANATATAQAKVDVPRAESLPSGSLQALVTLDTKGKFGGEVGLGVRVVERWWLVAGAQWTPGAEVRGGLGVRKDF